jgi:hypothetical protein
MTNVRGHVGGDTPGRFEPGFHRVPDFPCHRLLGSAGIDDEAAAWLLGRDRKIGVAQLPVKLDILRFEPIGRGAAAALLDALERGLNRHVEDHGEVGRKIADRNPFEALDQPLVDMAEHTLVDAGRIGKAVADHPFARCQRRQDGALDMVVAGGREQHRFHLRPERLCGAGQEHVADDLRTRRTARFPGQLHANSERLKAQRQHRGLGRFAGALTAFKGDKFSLHYNRLCSISAVTHQVSLTKVTAISI